MKRQRGFSLLLVCLLAFGMAFALLSCTINLPEGTSGGSTSYTGGSSSTLSGTYYYNSSLYINFRTNGTFTAYAEGQSGSGTYTISGSTLRLSDYFFGYSWTIVNSTTLRDADGDYWRK